MSHKFHTDNRKSLSEGLLTILCFLCLQQFFRMALIEFSTQRLLGLPEGYGIAAQYPGDDGLEDDPRVIFVERFDEATLGELFQRWENIKVEGSLKLVPDKVPGAADDQCLLMEHIGRKGTGCHLYRRLLPGYKLLFARFYVRFSKDCAPIHHLGTHLGGLRPSTSWPQGHAGERPNGSDRFNTQVEPGGQRWTWDFYTYWVDMPGHGDGRYWGTPFLTGIKGPSVAKERWICIELMVKLNNPVDKPNGEQAFWIDGRLWRCGSQIVSHLGPNFPRGYWRGGWWSPDEKSPETFKGFCWRTVSDLLINYLWTYVYITEAPPGHVSKVWWDNIVVATEYIGPMLPKKSR